MKKAQGVVRDCGGSATVDVEGRTSLRRLHAARWTPLLHGCSADVWLGHQHCSVNVTRTHPDLGLLTRSCQAIDCFSTFDPWRARWLDGDGTEPPCRGHRTRRLANRGPGHDVIGWWCHANANTNPSAEQAYRTIIPLRKLRLFFGPFPADCYAPSHGRGNKRSVRPDGPRGLAP